MSHLNPDRGDLPVKSESAVPLSEYIERRKRVLKALKKSTGIIFAGEGGSPLLGKWMPDRNFLYLTGIENEPGAAVLFDPTVEDEKRKIILFLRPLNIEVEKWDGYRQEIGPDLKEKTGFETVMRAGGIAGTLTGAAKRGKSFACLHPFAVYPAEVSPDLKAFQSVAQRVPGVSIFDQTNLLPSLRAIKSSTELKLMQQAITATAAGFAAIVKLIKPGVSERLIADTLEFEYRKHGAETLAYNSIVGSGLNSTVLHYNENNNPIKDGDLIVIDSGGAFKGYAADITRTYPANGKFNSEQRDVYEVVLKAELAAIKAVRPGVKMSDVDAAAREVIEKAGMGHAFIHGIGHQLGLEVHDVTPTGPLKPGMVVTIEPGVYLPDKKLGVRIEDDILVTSSGNKNLTIAVPKSVKDIEAAMAA
jgi:Xaa-Pro aminopeptidase